METLKENRKQIKQYQLIHLCGREIKILATANRKRDLEREFSYCMRIIRRLENSIINRKGKDWAIVTTYGESNHWLSVYYIRLIKL